MSDRLTQLQVCVDQLVEQFNAAVTYINTHSEQSLLDEDPTSVTNLAASAPLPGQNQGQNQGQTAVPGPPGQLVPVNSISDHPLARAEAETNFENTINELSTDIILKTRQITMLVDSLPGVGISEESQLKLIQELAEELDATEKQRIAKIKEKDELLQWCESLILDVATGISKTKT